MKTDFQSCLVHKVGFKGFGIAEDKLSTTAPFIYEGKEYTLKHGKFGHMKVLLFYYLAKIHNNCI